MKNIISFWKKLTFQAKIVFCFWTIGVIGNMATEEHIYSIPQILVVWMGGCLIYVGLVQYISRRFRRKSKNIAQTSVSADKCDSHAPSYGTIMQQTGTVVEHDPAANTASIPEDQFIYDTMDGHAFEYYCADLLSKNGYDNVEVTQGSGDQGIDIIAFKEGIKYGIQCKCYSHSIGNKAVQEAFSGKTYYGCHVAAVLTNQYFTKSAKQLAASNKVILWDRDKLQSFIAHAHT